jgi:hypothetical protein
LTAKDATGGNSTLFVDPVLEAIQDFLCKGTDLVVLNDEGVTVCWRTVDDESMDVLPAVITEDKMGVLVRDSAETEGTIRWTTWLLTFQVVQVGDTFFDQAKNVNQTMDGQQVMANVAQLALDVSIMEGHMDEQLTELGAFMSPVGEELDNFFHLEDDGDYNDNNWSYAKAARILRQVGIIMFLVNLVITVLLTRLGRRRRLARDQDGKGIMAGGLASETGVDHMLDVGRRESIKAIHGSSEFIKSSAEFNHLNLDQAYVGVPVESSSRATRKTLIPGAGDTVNVEVFYDV